jgi:hypothetical protein
MHSPFYLATVPKGEIAQIDYRRLILRSAKSDRHLQQTLWTMSARDPLFFINTFVYIYEPRAPLILPFNTYSCQDDAIMRIHASLGRCDVGIGKSRDMGGTWVVLATLFWRWLFHPMQSFLVASRTEDMVDSTDDPDTAFWKLDFMLRHLPNWMQPNLGHRHRSHMHLKNPWNGSVIDGEASTGNLGRGGRRLGVFTDEISSWTEEDGYRAAASTQSTTKTRILLSTPQGARGYFYDVMCDLEVEIMRIWLHWSLHPDKRRGLYYSEEGKLVVTDDTYSFPADYGFQLDNKLRSPWYDSECSRTNVPTIIAQELDISFVGSDSMAFDAPLVDAAIKRDARPPLRRGEILGDVETSNITSFVDDPRGRLLLWTHLSAINDPPAGEYAIGCDIATGSSSKKRGASYSVAQIYNRRTGCKVGKLAVNSVDPKQFAKIVVALCRWFKNLDGEGAFLIWEANGPGRWFGDEVLRLDYYNVYYRRDEESVKKKQRGELKPGFVTSKESKKQAFKEYERAIAAGECVNRCETSLSETKQYRVTPDGKFVHVKSATIKGGIGSSDPMLTGDNHGDHVVADAVAWHSVKDHRVSLDLESVVEDQKRFATASLMSYEGRRNKYDREERARKRSKSW